MQISTKIPVSKTEIAEIMEVDKAALDVWNKFPKMRAALKDYNFGVNEKLQLVERLKKISQEALADKEYFMSAGVEKVIQKVLVLY